LLALAPEALLAQSSSARGGAVKTTTGSAQAIGDKTVGVGAPNAGSNPNPAAPNGQSGYSGGANMNEGAKSSQQQALMGAATNGVAAGYWFKKCSKQKYWACALGALHVAQGGMMLSGALGAGRTAAATQYGLGGSDGVVNPGADLDGDGIPDAHGLGGGSGAFADKVAQTQRGLDSLASKFDQAGVKVSPDGRSVALPDGRTVPSSAFGSHDGLKALGLSDAQIAEYDSGKAALKARMKGKVKALAVEDGGGLGGGGFGGSGSGGGGGRGEAGFDFGGLFGDKRDRKTASVKGLSKQLGDDRIGVQADNIFEMISRQYQKEKGRRSFIQPAAAPPASSSP